MLKQTLFYLAIAGLVFAPCTVRAQDALPPIDVLPARDAQTKGLVYDTNDITHPVIKTTPDKSELVRLDQSAHSIIVGNPQHLSIIAETSKILVLVPKAPGATYFTVLDEDGNLIMQRHVLIAAPKENYVRVRRSCAGAENDACRETTVFYCPDMCHNIRLEDTETGAGESQDAAAGAANAGGEIAGESAPANEGDAAPENLQ